MIITIKNQSMIDEVLEGVSLIIGMDKDLLNQMLLRSLAEEDKHIIADIVDGKARGFMFSTIENLDGKDVVFIQACYSNKKGNVQVMLDNLIYWAKSIGIKDIVFMSKRNPKAWQRKYKFKPIYTVMQREIL